MPSDAGPGPRTPSLTSSLRSPLALILLVIGAVIGLVWLGAAGLLLGLVGYGAGALIALPKAPTGPAIDPFVVNEPWRQFVQSALRSRRRFTDGVTATRDGPLRDHLDDLGRRVDEAVAEVWRIAKRGNTVAKARRQVDEASLRRKIDSLRSAAGGEDPTGSTAATIESLEAQLATGARLDELLTRTQSQLELLDARLTESVTRAHELAATADDATDFEPLDADLDSIVTEMESVRAALEETRTLGTADGTADRTAPPPTVLGPGNDAGAIPSMPEPESASAPEPAMPPDTSGDQSGDDGRGQDQTGPDSSS